MQITTTARTTREEQRVSVTATIDGLTLPWGYRRPRTWRPITARTTFERWRRNGEPWSEWVMLSAHVKGYNVRSDDTDGAAREIILHSRPDGFDHDDAALAPVWDYLARRRPGADLPDHFLPGEDVPDDLATLDG